MGYFSNGCSADYFYERHCSREIGPDAATTRIALADEETRVGRDG